MVNRDDSDQWDADLDDLLKADQQESIRKKPANRPRRPKKQSGRASKPRVKQKQLRASPSSSGRIAAILGLLLIAVLAFGGFQSIFHGEPDDPAAADNAFQAKNLETPENFFVMKEVPRNLQALDSNGPIEWAGSIKTIKLPKPEKITLPEAEEFPPVRSLSHEASVGHSLTAEMQSRRVVIRAIVAPGGRAPGYAMDKPFDFFDEDDRLEWVERTEKKRGSTTFKTGGYWKLP